MLVTELQKQSGNIMLLTYKYHLLSVLSYETRSHYEAQAGLEPMEILPPKYSKCHYGQFSPTIIKRGETNNKQQQKMKGNKTGEYHVYKNTK